MQWLTEIRHRDFQFNVCNMYIMQSRPPSEQSVSGGTLQTVTKLCATIGFGIATAIFNAVQGPLSPPGGPPSPRQSPHDSARPYAAVFWFCTAACALSILLVPFLTIKTQGGPSGEGQGEK